MSRECGNRHQRFSAEESGGLLFFDAGLSGRVVRAKIVADHQHPSGNGFTAQSAELILQSNAAAGEFEFDQALCDQKSVN